MISIISFIERIWSIGVFFKNSMKIPSYKKPYFTEEETVKLNPGH
jgi:hypothetical protein